MIALYPHIKHLHWLLILMSVLLYNFRFWLKIRQPERVFAPFLRIAPMVNDTFLLLSGITMIILAKWQPFGVSTWLGIKLALVILYIMVGICSFRSVAHRVRAIFLYGISMLLIALIAWLAHCKMGVACHFFANWI